MMPQTRCRKRYRTGIRSSALLLPALLRYDWQHSSSQLPITLNDARRTSSLGGRYCFRRTPGKPSLTIQKSPVAIKTHARVCAAFSTHEPNACGSCMGAIPIARFCPSSGQAITFSSVGRRSPPPNVSDKDWQPLLLPSCQSISATPAGSPPPAGVAFLHCNQPIPHGLFTFVAPSPDFGQNSA